MPEVVGRPKGTGEARQFITRLYLSPFVGVNRIARPLSTHQQRMDRSAYTLHASQPFRWRHVYANISRKESKHSKNCTIFSLASGKPVILTGEALRPQVLRILLARHRADTDIRTPTYFTACQKRSVKVQLPRFKWLAWH